mgnify:CR=1 FL=1
MASTVVIFAVLLSGNCVLIGKSCAILPPLEIPLELMSSKLFEMLLLFVAQAVAGVPGWQYEISVFDGVPIPTWPIWLFQKSMF